MRQAFSLIEVIIAISLGMVVLITMYAGFRVATQSIAITERLALENKLLIGGMVSAMEEVDQWTAFDRPDHQPLRTTGALKVITPGAGGYTPDGSDWSTLPQPFTPFGTGSGSGSWSVSGAGLAYASTWLVNDPATWYRGDGALALTYGKPTSAIEVDKVKPFHTDQSPWGNYALFACAGEAVQVTPQGTETVPLDAERRWLAAQHKGLKYGLGFYGWYAYLPANAFIDYYDVDDGTARGIRSFELRELLASTAPTPTMAELRGAGRMRRQMGSGYGGNLQTGAERAVTRPFSLYTNHLGIATFAPDATAEQKRKRLIINRQMAGAWIPPANLAGKKDEGASTYPTLLASLAGPRPLIATGPRHWPTVSSDVRRTMKWSMMINLCTVRLEDPLTGRMSELSFTTTGTTLRGARMSRGLDL